MRFHPAKFLRITSRWKRPIIIAGLVLMAAYSCRPLPSYRYKLTIELSTPSGVQSASTVRQVNAWHQPQFLPDVNRMETRVLGEAIAFPLPNNQAVVALLDAENYGASASRIARSVLAPVHLRLENGDLKRYATAAEWLSEHDVVSLVPKQLYPIFVRYLDRSNPHRVQTLNGSRISDQLGSGYSIKRIIIETTDEEVQYRIHEVLPWAGHGNAEITYEHEGGGRTTTTGALQARKWFLL